MSETDPTAARYWRSNLRVLSVLLSIWAVAAFGLGVAFVEPLNAFHIGGFPVGFWFAQQGSILIFVILVLVYALWMDRIERRIQRDTIDPVTTNRGTAARSSPPWDCAKQTQTESSRRRTPATKAS